MRNLFLVGVIYSLLLISVLGCRPNHDVSSTEIMQILWQGDYDDGNNVREIRVMFNFESSGYYVIDDEVFGFSYYRKDRIIQISGYNGRLLNGAWFIDNLTTSKLIMKKHPLKTKLIMLDLKRVL